MPKIHFASIFGVDLDSDIMVHWCHHYLRMGYDTYTVFLHTLDRSSGAYEFCRKGFEAAGFTVLDAADEPYSCKLPVTLFGGLADSLNPLDYLVIADSDEFHDPGPWGNVYQPDKLWRSLILSCDILYGTLVDRWGDGLFEANPRVPLDAQYQHCGDLFSILRDRSDAADKSRWWATSPTKILAARAGMPVAYEGSHGLYEPVDESEEKRGCIVNHFSWRHTITERLKTKFYYHESYNQAVKEFFNVKEPVCV